MRPIRTLFTSLALLTCLAGPALACLVEGHVYCDATGQPMAGIRVDVTAADGSFSAYGVTNEDGHYEIPLLCTPSCYHLVASVGVDESIVTPASGSYDFCANETNGFAFVRDWVVSSPSCATGGACWLTAGGAKFSPITGENVGDYTKVHNWGGNVYPGCSSTAGDGGSWNEIDNLNRRHFHGTHIEVIRCGNIDGIPPGSTSPVTPFNYIDFQGWGTLKGIKGNREDFGTVYFTAHCEDRNEPGSNGQRDGLGKDRYFLNVFTDPANPTGSSVLLVDVDGNPATVDPVTITDGNMQIHVSSCDAPAAVRISLPSEEGTSASRTAWLGNAYPNPGHSARNMQFGLPTSASVSLRVFDAAGRLVRELESGVLPAGQYRSTWDLRNTRGDAVASGVYFVRMAIGKQVFTRVITVTP